RRNHDDRGTGKRRRTPSHAGGLSRSRWFSMRCLHVRPDHVRSRIAGRTGWRRQWIRPGIDERQHLPLWRVPEHTRRRPGGAKVAGGRLIAIMRTLTYSRPASFTDAFAEYAKARPAAFLAGGTTLLDLVKLDVMRPDHLVDVNRLGLDRIEPAPDGGVKIGAL